MKLPSPYLNPFQPFPELEVSKRVKESDEGKEKVRHAIEDNMSRAVFSVLSNAESTLPLVKFLEKLTPEHSSPVLRSRVKKITETLRSIKQNSIEYNLQSWPSTAMKECEKLELELEVLLVGVSSSHKDVWTRDQRPATESPRPDACIYIEGIERKILLVFEFKTDTHPLDATQISSYVHFLKHFLKLPSIDNVPKVNAGDSLISEDAKKVKTACADFVLDASWDAVVQALEAIQEEESVDHIGKWLCRKSVEYLKWHIFPPYRGIQTILKWLDGPDTPDRRYHLRTLVADMGKALNESRGEALEKSIITFATTEKEDNSNIGYDFKRGAGSALYVKLNQNGNLLRRDWLEGYGKIEKIGKIRKIDAVLWFRFAEDKSDSERIGLEYYIQAKGSQSSKGCQDKIAWNEARERHLKCASKFETVVANWISKTPSQCLMNVSTVRFNGKKLNWQGGGIEDPNGKYSNQIELKEALKFLQNNQEELWDFPEVGNDREIKCFAKRVCKPALSLLVPLNIKDLEECGNDVQKLQKFMQEAVEKIQD